VARWNNELIPRAKEDITDRGKAEKRDHGPRGIGNLNLPSPLTEVLKSVSRVNIFWQHDERT
jgi:hypothetical protein